MPGLDAERYAALLCDWCLEVEPGQSVLVSAPHGALEALCALEAAILARGAWPIVDVTLPGARERFFRHARDAQLDGPSPVELAMIGALSSTLRIEAPANPLELAGVDPALPTRVARGRRAYTEALHERRWALSLWPTEGLAQAAGMGLGAYTEFVERALFLDRPDPLAAWRELRDRQAELVDRLAHASEIRLVSERTDLTLRVAGRTWRNSDGRRNMPSGEVFTSPHETSANGHVYFDVPSTRSGATVAGISLRFVDGEVDLNSASAEVGQAVLAAALAADPGARRLGEIGIGTNRGVDRATGSTLLDEKMGGTVHLALGRSYPECGGVNESAIHWDIICDLRRGGEIRVDGELLSRDGAFV